MMSMQTAASVPVTSGGPPTISFGGKTFIFRRNTTDDHRGDWFCLESWRQSPPNTALPMEFQKDLTELAKARGIIEAHNYALHPRKEEKKAVSVRAPREAQPRMSGGMLKAGKSGAHNPMSRTLPVSEAPPKKHFPFLKLKD